MYPCMLFRYYDDLLKFVDTLLLVQSKLRKDERFFFQKQKQTEKNIDADFGRGVARAVYLLVSQSFSARRKDPPRVLVGSWVIPVRALYKWSNSQSVIKGATAACLPARTRA